MDVLELLNPWWKEKTISKELALPYRRKAFPKIKKLLDLRQIVVLSGLRRVGKSTLMYQLIEDLLKATTAEKILYFSFDERTENVLELLNKYSELTKVDWKKEKCYVFFDEIQKLPDWSNKIKLIYDSHPNIKFTISGSSSFELEREAKINLAGRHFAMYIEPLSFREFIDLKGSKIDLENTKLWEAEIKKEFESYLFRPFPEIVRLEELSLVKSYVKDNVIEKVLKIDLPKRFKNINEDILTTLVTLFYERPGTYINYDELSKELKISKTTLIRHIYYLEFAYVLRKVKNFRPSVRAASRKLQRAYPYHFSLEFGWSGKTDFETIAASFIDAKYYWREGGKEVDFLVIDKDILPVEVKEGHDVHASELASLIYFMKTFGIKKGAVIYSGKEEQVKIDGLIIEKIPLWKLFAAGSGALKEKMK